MAISPDGIIGNAVEAVTSQLAILNNTAGQYRGELSAALAQIAAVQVKDVADLPAFLPPDLPVPENPLADIPQYQPESLQFGAEPQDINIDGLPPGARVVLVRAVHEGEEGGGIGEHGVHSNASSR